MKSPETPKAKLPSLEDYLVRHDLAALLEEAKLDYNQAIAGGPRHMDQKDIAARFRDVRRQPKAPDDEPR
jgi:hypothetical protein